MNEEPFDCVVFTPVPISTLRVDSVTDFDLYFRGEASEEGANQASCKPLWKRQNYVLYRQKNLPFTDTAFQRLADNDVQVLYVDSRQEAAYQRYVERHLGQLLDDPEMDLDAKSSVLYTAAHGLVKEAIEAPQTDQIIQRSGDFVQQAAKFMISEQAALKSLMQVMSYDYYTYTHSVNVFVFSLALAQRQELAPALVLSRYGLGTLLHDIGKSRIDARIINCKGKLTDAQWASMKQHPELGCTILEEQGVTDKIVLDVIRHHHEKIDGSGYPAGLKGDEISKFVRITTITDIFDALTTKRSYKHAIRSFPALKLMQVEMTGELDASLFREFILMIGDDSA